MARDSAFTASPASPNWRRRRQRQPASHAPDVSALGSLRSRGWLPPAQARTGRRWRHCRRRRARTRSRRRRAPRPGRASPPELRVFSRVVAPTAASSTSALAARAANTEPVSVYGPVRRLWLREARPQVESRALAPCRYRSASAPARRRSARGRAAVRSPARRLVVDPPSPTSPGAQAFSTLTSAPSSTLTTRTFAPGRSSPATRHRLSPTRMRP